MYPKRVATLWDAALPVTAIVTTSAIFFYDLSTRRSIAQKCDNSNYHACDNGDYAEAVPPNISLNHKISLGNGLQHGLTTPLQ